MPELRNLIFAVLLAAAVPGMCASGAQWEKLLPFVPADAAEIDGRRIPKAEFFAFLNSMNLDPKQYEDLPEGRLKGFAAGMIAVFTDAELLTRIAEKNGFLPSPQLARERLDSVLAAMSPEKKNAFAEMLAKRGLSLEKYQDALSRDPYFQKAAAREKWIRTAVQPSLRITDSEIRTFYDSYSGFFKVPERVSVRQIRIPFGKKPEISRRHAAELLSRLKKGADFDAAAAKESGGSASAEEVIPRGKYGREFDSAVFRLEPGTCSGVFRMPDGWRIARVIRKSPEETAPFEEVREKIRSTLLQRSTDRAVNALLEKEKTLRKVRAAGF